MLTLQYAGQSVQVFRLIKLVHIDGEGRQHTIGRVVQRLERGPYEMILECRKACCVRDDLHRGETFYVPEQAVHLWLQLGIAVEQIPAQAAA